jgi:hypothetical protein
VLDKNELKGDIERNSLLVSSMIRQFFPNSLRVTVMRPEDKPKH